ncbi:MAG: hypothetical protein B7Z80_01045 [Rhodospirillales bacterium 20-64-7]|nr:MAG: hypothetical protein B7Z80_01045 [Rhodospirillales bacterium 20-64-7]
MSIFPESQSLEPAAYPEVELCLRVDAEVFGVTFVDLAEARSIAGKISARGRDVEIFEKDSGRILFAATLKAPS